MKKILLAFAVGLAVMPAALSAGEITSVTTDYRDLCKLTEKPDESGDEYYSCPGFGDIGIRTLVGQDANHVSFGPKADEECAFQQGFVTYGVPASSVEWRVKDDRAFAAIQSWSVSRAAASDQGDDWLVVTRLEPGKTCSIAAVEAKLLDAIGQARRAADEKSTRFDCAKDMPEILSSQGGVATDFVNGVPCSGGP